MRGWKILSLVFLLFFSQACAFERKARLQFQPNTPVQLTSEISLNFTQSLPGLSLSTKGTQALSALLTLESSDTGLPIVRPPFQGTFVLKALKIALKANNEEISFDSEKTEPSLYLSQVSKLIDRPIVLRFDENFALVKGDDSLKLLSKQLPVLEEINPVSFLTDLFFLAFSLCGEELKEGMLLSRSYPLEKEPSLPVKVNYEITAIDDYSVQAKIKGEIEKKTFPLESKVKINGKDEEKVMVSLMGNLDGHGKWNRDNGLISDLALNYHYNANFSLGEWEWMMHIEIKAHHLARLKH